MIFARWLSAHFAVWCDKKIAELLQQHPKYQKQFPELSVIFEKLEQQQRITDQQADLLKPPVEVGIKQTLLDYQHTALKTQGWSWQHIAQELNARGTVAV